MRILRSAPRMSVMISAIGVSYLIQNTATYITGGQPMTYPTIPFLSDTVKIAGTSTKWVTILTPFLVLVLVIALTQLINHTKVGMAMRAVAKDFETAQLMGIRINTIISVTFIIGSALAAVKRPLSATAKSAAARARKQSCGRPEIPPLYLTFFPICSISFPSPAIPGFVPRY